MKGDEKMHERIKLLRKELGLTQQEFSDKLKVSRNTVATYEAGNSIPSESAVNNICHTFNVKESWLRTGEGEMFRQYSRDEEIAAFIGSIQMSDDDGDDFKRQVIAGLAALDTEEWKVLERIAMKMMKMNLDQENKDE